ncbi:MAG: L,D-transpeptidase family protein [Candidatus Moranbacteria bacterium]|nr:L,D-transpeptidase family protein [Candidatus Moranbacteria bacterium]
MKGTLSRALPYSRVGEVTKAALNPSWTPTSGMIRRAIRSGKRPPRPSAPGAKGNPLGGFKLYFLIGGNGELGLHATTPEHEAEISEAAPNRQTNGCVRMRKSDMIAMEEVVLFQNGYDMGALLSEIGSRPTKPIFLTLRDRPKVIYLDE